MFLDEEHIVAVLIKPLACIFVWIVQLYHMIVHQSYVYWNLWVKEKQVVPKPASDSIVLIPAVELAQKIRNRQLTALEVIEAYIKRIELVDPMIHALVQRNYQNALETAKAIDSVLDAIEQDSEELNNLAETKPLLGVPFTIKDQFLIKGLRTTVGMPDRRNAELATDDADIVKSLREAGAIPLGLSNVPEGIMWGEGKNEFYI
ncbi:Fatty-acid amide hydrolase 2 [Aphelenchoides besseyi]|nr:Fatty-acid amide hydrolase 2 [Aphelenchoides besseyi]KAI6194542.1 Fatty-acid amide hydrolase 2 [Aphelenchoides besseyi]